MCFTVYLGCTTYMYVREMGWGQFLCLMSKFRQGPTYVHLGPLLNSKYVLHPFSCALCSTPPLPPPSLKGKGTSTQALCSTYLLFKSGPLRPTFNYKYVLHPFSCAYMQHSPIPTSDLKREGKFTLAYMQHIFII